MSHCGTWMLSRFGKQIARTSDISCPVSGAGQSRRLQGTRGDETTRNKPASTSQTRSHRLAEPRLSRHHLLRVRQRRPRLLSHHLSSHSPRGHRPSRQKPSCESRTFPRQNGSATGRPCLSVAARRSRHARHLSDSPVQIFLRSKVLAIIPQRLLHVAFWSLFFYCYSPSIGRKSTFVYRFPLFPRVSVEEYAWCYFAAVLFCMYIVGHHIVIIAIIDSIWQTSFRCKRVDGGNHVVHSH